MKTHIKTATLREEIEKGHLSSFYIEQVNLEIDLCKIGIIGKDFDKGDLDKLICGQSDFVAEEIYRHGHKFLVNGDMIFRPTICFTPHINSAESIAEELKKMDINAACISNLNANLDQLYAKFKSGYLQCLILAETLLKDFELPWIEMVVLACPSLDINSVTQRIKYGIQLSPKTGKEDCKILEFIGQTNTGQDLIGSLDLVLRDSSLPHNIGDGANNPKIQQEMVRKMKNHAQQILDSGETSDPLYAVDLARELTAEENKVERERKLEAGRSKHKRNSDNQAKLESGNLSTKVTSYAGLPISPRGGRAVSRNAPDSARPEQLRKLQELTNGQLGHASHEVTAAQAGHQIALLETRAHIGLASYAQIKTLVENNVAPERAHVMSTEQAEIIIKSLKL